MKLTLNEFLHNIIYNVINEANYNYHLTRNEINGNGKPYASDNKELMHGRETGHFGSGTYFASYQDKNFHKYGENISEPNFIKIKNGIYRVDMDFYKNLYKVESKQEGDLLYTTLRCLNAIYNNVSNGKYDNASLYQKVRNNISYLELEDISYKGLINMLKKYMSENNIQSFSTYFMEQNGYNGVNVSGIPEYDNTTHGSVIYNLDNNNIRQINPKHNKKTMPFYMSDTNSSYNDTVGKSDMDDNNREYIRGEYVSNIEKMDTNKQVRYIKNALYNNNFLDYNVLNRLNEQAIRIYFKLLYNKSDFGRWYVSLNDLLKHNSKYINDILEYNLLYYVNLPSDKDYSVILELTNNYWKFYDDDNQNEKKEFVDNIYNQLHRNLTPQEEKILHDFISY